MVDEFFVGVVKRAPKVWKPFKVVHCIEELCLILLCEAISKSNWAYNIIDFNDLRKNVHFGPHHFLPFSLLIYIWFSCLIAILCYSQDNINIIPLPCFDISYFHKSIIFNLEFALGGYVNWCSNEGWWFHILLFKLTITNCFAPSMFSWSCMYVTRMLAKWIRNWNFIWILYWMIIICFTKKNCIPCKILHVLTSGWWI